MDSIDEQTIVWEAVSLAESWQDRANALLTREEKRTQKQMRRLLQNPLDKVILTRLIDQSFRSGDNRRVADQVGAVFDRFGVPAFFSGVEKLLVWMFRALGRRFPNILVPRMIDRMRDTSSRAIIAGESEVLGAHLRKRKSQGVRVNINHLGEAVLGEREAVSRLNTYIRDLEDPAIETISVKISTLCSQIQALGFEHTLAILKERLGALYRAAKENCFTGPDGTRSPKFVTLDMEAYTDLEITFRAFVETLSEPEFLSHSAGIALQAYLPDSFSIQEELTAWAVRRISRGGAPVRARIVKGANMEMEKLESALFDWPLAPYGTKCEVDANYKRMIRFGMIPSHIQAVNLGVASHNLFELAYAWCLAEANGVQDFFSFEMLEGMADHVRRAISGEGGRVLVYAPVAGREEFINAIAYLVRRLDENTTPGNFLRCAPGLKVGSKDWASLKAAFIRSCQMIDIVRAGPNRTQNRREESFPDRMGTRLEKVFANEPNTDWSLAANRQWAKEIRRQWKRGPATSPVEIPLVIEDMDLFQGRETRERRDPGQFQQPVVVSRHARATVEDIERAIAVARRDPDGWRKKSLSQRHEILSGVARALREARGTLIGAAAAETGKVFTETDVEVSEAIDFAEYYPFSAGAFDALPGVAAHGRGVMGVISPWNFPVAIPCGGIMASLSAGNTVLFKPATDAVLTAWELCQCFWRAGVSRSTLQFVPCDGSSVGARLTDHPEIDGVILTGGTDTGLAMLAGNPGLSLFAETGGKNATIVTEMADRDQAIRNIVYSAFGNSGQKCSATSLLILERAVYEDARFKRQLVDAAESFSTGTPWEFHNRMGPLIRPAEGHLARALTTLEPGESWALKPQCVDGNPQLWTPGIKYGVQPGSYSHLTEFFGPVLGVMCAENLDAAISMVNATGYGLTSGIESLDPREQARWRKGIRAGNLYLNRGTTGAVTLRQPFGGMGKSALGPGIKAGGPDYVAQFMNFDETGYPQVGVIQGDSVLRRLADSWRLRLRWGDFIAIREDITKTVYAIFSYLHRMEGWFSRELDFFNLPGQDNVFRYLPVGKVLIRVHPDDSLFEVLARVAAARAAGCPTTVSLPPGMDREIAGFLDSADGEALLAGAPVIVQEDSALVDSLPRFERIRYAAPDRVPGELLTAAAKTGFFIARAKVLMEGRIELLHYHRQQAVCDTYHRYGNLGERGLDLLS
jgi:RHH-type transcriptional regulator, proline utilization regulon repressor / proline dehydrogenase / delta 1-pyrroline-5-carboxylate dehydrogenase